MPARRKIPLPELPKKRSVRRMKSPLKKRHAIDRPDTRLPRRRAPR